MNPNLAIVWGPTLCRKVGFPRRFFDGPITFVSLQFVGLRLRKEIADIFTDPPRGYAAAVWSEQGGSKNRHI